MPRPTVYCCRPTWNREPSGHNAASYQICMAWRDCQPWLMVNERGRALTMLIRRRYGPVSAGAVCGSMGRVAQSIAHQSINTISTLSQTAALCQLGHIGRAVTSGLSAVFAPMLFYRPGSEIEQSHALQRFGITATRLSEHTLFSARLQPFSRFTVLGSYASKWRETTIFASQQENIPSWK